MRLFSRDGKVILDLLAGFGIGQLPHHRLTVVGIPATLALVFVKDRFRRVVRRRLSWSLYVRKTLIDLYALEAELFLAASELPRGIPRSVDCRSLHFTHQRFFPPVGFFGPPLFR